MSLDPLVIDPLLRELQVILDEQVVLLETRLAQTKDLFQSIARYDDDALEKLLPRMETQMQRQSLQDANLRRCRGALARVVGCDPGRLQLGELCSHLSPGQWAPVEARRQRIFSLVQALRRTHMETVLLLNECARVNRLLLASLFPGAQSVTVYDAGGATHWRDRSGLVDAEL